MDDEFVLVRFHYLMKQGQEELTELEEMILDCAAGAKFTKDQWDELLEKVDAGAIEDLLDLNPEDYEGCDFKPLMRRRVLNFQQALYDNYWSHRIATRAPPPPPPLPGMEDVGVVTAPTASPAPPAPAAHPDMEK